MRFNHKLKLILVLLAFSWQLQSADRALIIGITEYKNIPDLKGINYDVGMATKIAKMLAFEDSQIKIITGAQATKENIQRAFQTWLKQGVGSNDRIFVYFSGHGGRVADKNGDEKDGQDEFITTYNLKQSFKEGGYIIDDELSSWLSAIPSGHKIVMLDSCHSGTASKSLPMLGKKMGNLHLQSKKFSFIDNPKSSFSSKGSSNEKSSKFIEDTRNMLTLAAAKDYEQAQASDEGSLFTLGFFNALQTATQNGEAKTAQYLVNQAGLFIQKNLSEDVDKIHTPVVFGDRQMANQPLTIKASRNSQGPNWQELKQMARLGTKMSARSSKNNYNEGEIISFDVNIPANGYLNVITVDAHDELLVVYPNKYSQENSVKAGKIKFPNDLLPFEIEATKPKGDSFTVFVLTSQPINLYKESIDVRDFAGTFSKEFATMTESAFRGMKINARERSNKTYTVGIKTSVR